MSNDKQKSSGGNKQFHRAKKKKNDEFYTQFTDIERELSHYKEHFKGKTVLCNCDDPRVSNFFKYFALNFEYFGLKRIITTCYKNQCPDLFSQNTSEQAVYLIYDGNNGESMPDWDKVDIKPLKGNGDFRSKECIELLLQSDIVVTNPPFSLFREYVAQLMAFHKKFVILGNKNSVTYKEIFPLIKENKIWTGMQPMGVDMLFDVPEDCAEDLLKSEKKGSKYRVVDGVVKGRSASVWFTNLEHRKRHEKLILYKRYNAEEYPIYDNYNAINVDKVKDIPCDYNGVIGVPITFLDKYNPKQFEIIGIGQSSTEKEAGIPILREYNDFKEMRQSGVFTGATGKKANGNPVLKGKSHKGNFLYNPDTNEYVHSAYARIFIKRI